MLFLLVLVLVLVLLLRLLLLFLHAFPTLPTLPTTHLHTLPTPHTPSPSDQFLSDLLAAELLARDPITPGQFLFTIPGAGAFMGQLVAGRSELLALVSKKRWVGSGSAVRS
jgi:hypothetical protein